MLDEAVRAWFDGRFSGFSTVQKKALVHTTHGENTLILAPTGSGKTLAGFLSVLSRLAAQARQGRLENTTAAVYVAPLRSLSRDIHRNLEEPLAAVNASLPSEARIRMEVRTGDTEAAERARMQRRRPHLLLTTPESLSALLSQAGWHDGLRVETVIVDEIHAFAESKRGSLLALSLERLEARGPGLQRIGLSATANPVDAVQTLLCGERECFVAQVPVAKAHRLEIAAIADEIALPPAGYMPDRAAQAAAQLVRSARCSLVFTSTRSAAERLGLALKVLLPEHEERIAVHHASIERETRLSIEDGLSTGALKAVVCSTSLELGVDFAAVDQVLLVGAPRGVSHAVQRLGRSGHRVDGVARGWLLPLSLPDLMECIALRAAVRAGRLDALRVPVAPLDVLAQVLLGMAVEREWGIEEAYDLVRRAGPYRALERSDYLRVLEYLAGGGRVLGGSGRYGKIVIAGDRFRVASRRTARSYYMNIGTISDDYHVQVLARGNRRLGAVEESFLTTLERGEAFVIGGQTVKVKRLHQNTAIVAPAAGERVKTPRWMGGRMSLTARLAEEERALRRALRAAWSEGGRPACERVLRREWKVDASTARRAGAFLERQCRAAPIPMDEPVQVERLWRGRSVLIVFHVVAGRGVNRSLAWVCGRRLGTEFGSVVANYDDHAFLLSLDARRDPGDERLRACFDPGGWREDLRSALQETEALGRKFRPIAETGQLLERRTARGPARARSSTWSGSLLYETFLKYEPDHPLLREAVREVLEDELDAGSAEQEAARLFTARWEGLELERPSPFSLPLFAAFNRETLLAQDPDRALEELTGAFYEEWA